MTSGPVLVVITGKDCIDCCQYEKLFKQIQDEIFTNKTLLHGKEIKMARVIVDDVPTIQARVNKLPEFFFYYKEMGYSFEHDYNAESVGLTLSKIIQPAKPIKEYSEFKEFLDKEISFEQNGHKVVAIKIIAIFSKKDELQYELKELKKTASHFAVYHDIQFALITKESLIDQILQEKSTLWFPSYMRSTIILINRKGEEKKFDPTMSADQLQNLILLKGKDIVEPLSIETQQLFRKLKLPVLVSFLDQDDTKTFQPHLKILSEVGKKFEGHMAVAYLNQSRHEDKRNSAGIFHNKIPALSIIMPSGHLSVPYPEDLDITTENLNKFIKSFFEGKLTYFEPPAKNDDEIDVKIEQREDSNTQKTYQNIDL